MHYAISTTWGPTDSTRASLPFNFATSALESGDTVMIMLFHDAVNIAVKGAHEMMMPVGPAQCFEDVFDNPKAEVIVFKPCADVRGITRDMLVPNCRFGTMNDYNAHVFLSNCKAVTF